MYLKKLYRYKKSLFALAVIGCAIQLIIFYKQGAVATPFLNYGMYSDKIVPASQYQVYKVYVDDKLLKGDDYSIQEWDKIYMPLYLYYGKDTINTQVIEVRNRLLNKLKLKKLVADTSFFENSEFNDAAFKSWYASYLASFSRQASRNIRVVKQNYQWNGQYLQPADSTLLLQNIQ